MTSCGMLAGEGGGMGGRECWEIEKDRRIWGKRGKRGKRGERLTEVPIGSCRR